MTTLLHAEKTPTQTKRALALGDRVLIRNPNPLQTEIGIVINIGKFSITVLTEDGENIVWAPHNLINIKDEHS